MVMNFEGWSYQQIEDYAYDLLAVVGPNSLADLFLEAAEAEEAVEVLLETAQEKGITVPLPAHQAA